MEASAGKVLGISVMTCLQAVRAAGLETSSISDLCGRDDAHLQQLWVDWPRAASIFRELEVMVPADRLGHIGATWVKRHPTWRAAAQFAGGVEGWLDLFWKTSPTLHPVMEVRWSRHEDRLVLEAQLTPGLSPSRWWFSLLLEAGRHAPTIIGDQPLEVRNSSSSETHLTAVFSSPPRRSRPMRTRPTDIPLSTIFEGIRLLTQTTVLDSFRDGALPAGVTPVADGPVAVAAHFKLTPAEGRVLKELVEGLAPIEIASHLGLAVGTVRVHLRHVFAKTRTRGQRELLRLVEQWTIR